MPGINSGLEDAAVLGIVLKAGSGMEGGGGRLVGTFTIWEKHGWLSHIDMIYSVQREHASIPKSEAVWLHRHRRIEVALRMNPSS